MRDLLASSRTDFRLKISITSFLEHIDGYKFFTIFGGLELDGYYFMVVGFETQSFGWNFSSTKYSYVPPLLVFDWSWKLSSPLDLELSLRMDLSSPFSLNKAINSHKERTPPVLDHQLVSLSINHLFFQISLQQIRLIIILYIITWWILVIFFRWKFIHKGWHLFWLEPNDFFRLHTQSKTVTHLHLYVLFGSKNLERDQ